jgi:hypothetical protein
MNRIAVLWVSGLGVAISACGSLDSNTTSAPALATITGKLSNSLSLDIPSSSDVRVAVVWRSNDFGQFNVAEDLPIQPMFPFKFTIALDGPPPEAAMSPEVPEVAPPPVGASAGGPPPSSGTGSPAPATGSSDSDSGASPDGGVIVLDTPAPAPASRYAVGSVVAYIDNNHNGKLDLVAADASAFVDQIVAANQEMAIAYFEGPILANGPFGFALVDGSGHRPKDGYNLVQVPVCTEPSPTSSNPVCATPPTAIPGGCSPFAWLDINATYPLDITSSPEVASLMCLKSDGNLPAVDMTGSGMGGPFDPSIQPAKYPDACDPNLTCASDGSDYLYATCMEMSQGFCKGTIENCTYVGFARPTPPPADWPCLK